MSTRTPPGGDCLRSLPRRSGSAPARRANRLASAPGSDNPAEGGPESSRRGLRNSALRRRESAGYIRERAARAGRNRQSTEEAAGSVMKRRTSRDRSDGPDRNKAAPCPWFQRQLRIVLFDRERTQAGGAGNQGTKWRLCFGQPSERSRDVASLHYGPRRLFGRLAIAGPRVAARRGCNRASRRPKGGISQTST